MTITRIRAFILSAALLTVVGATIAHAQTVAPKAPAAPTVPAAAAGDARWTPWLGCWRSTDDPGNTGTRVCVTRAGAGISLRTIVGGQLVSDELRVADGTPRPVREAGCTGTESTRWSADGQRAYRTAQASCGSETARSLAGVAYFVPGPVWIDVQTVTLNGATNVRVTGYTRAASQRLPDGTVVPTAPAGMAASLMSRGWTTDDVVEASAILPPDGVQAAISEGPTAFRLNAASLSQLADGRVAEGVIDLMVALTYPERFVVDRPSGGGGGGGFMLSGMSADPFFSPIVGPAALYDCYSPYGWASNSYWSGCAGYNPMLYGMYPGYYNGYYGMNGPYGAWIPTTPGAGPEPGPVEGGGRVVNGRGYMQVRPVETSSSGSSSADRSSGTSSGSSGTSSSGGSSSGATSSGYSGGGGGGGGGDRMAVPRPPGM